MMKMLAIVFAVGAAALTEGSAAYADNVGGIEARGGCHPGPHCYANPRPTSARAAVTAIGAVITTGTTVITGRITGAIITMARARTAITVPAITAAAPA